MKLIHKPRQVRSVKHPAFEIIVPTTCNSTYQQPPNLKFLTFALTISNCTPYCAVAPKKNGIILKLCQAYHSTLIFRQIENIENSKHTSPINLNPEIELIQQKRYNKIVCYFDAGTPVRRHSPRATSTRQRGCGVRVSRCPRDAWHVRCGLHRIADVNFRPAALQLGVLPRTRVPPTHK
jgi:hypothetical protein